MFSLDAAISHKRILTTSLSFPQIHLIIYHLRSVLQALSSAGLTVNVSKCSFGMQYIHYLGHLVGNGSLAVPEARVTHLANYGLPKSKKDLKSFIGLSRYYTRFIPSLANYTAILSPATSSQAPDAVLWTSARQDAFNCISKSLCHHTQLTIPLPTDTFTLHTDASGIGVGAVLNLVRDHCELPVSFFSRQLRGAELNYSVSEKEALAICCTVHHFEHFLYGSSFTVCTDHQPLVYLLGSKKLNKRLTGFVLKLNNYNTTIIYRKGKKTLMQMPRLAKHGTLILNCLIRTIKSHHSHVRSHGKKLRLAIPGRVWEGGDVGPLP